MRVSPNLAGGSQFVDLEDNVYNSQICLIAEIGARAICVYFTNQYIHSNHFQISPQ